MAAKSLLIANAVSTRASGPNRSMRSQISASSLPHASPWDLSPRPKEEGKLFRYALILNVFVIGVGSFLFHTYATPRASAADVISIGVFMLVYLG